MRGLLGRMLGRVWGCDGDVGECRILEGVIGGDEGGGEVAAGDGDSVVGVGLGLRGEDGAGC